MAKQVQLRRGSASDHTTFTGAVGELTYVSDDKTLRIHDGATAGGVDVGTGVINVKNYGATGDGTTDDTVAIQAAITHAINNNLTLFAPEENTFKVTSALDMKEIGGVDFRGTLSVATGLGGPAVTLGGESSSGVPKYFHFYNITDGSSILSPPSDPLLRIFGLKSCKFDIGMCSYVQLYADMTVSGGTSNAYNHFNMLRVTKLELKGEGSTSWINENHFTGGRMKTLYIGTTTSEYKHNNNIFNFPTFEGIVDINIQSGVSNRLENVRFEGVNDGSVTFSTSTHNNVFEVNNRDSSASSNNFVDIVNPATLTDNGIGNVIASTKMALYIKHELFSLGNSTTLLSDGSVPSTNQKGLYDRHKKIIGTAVSDTIPGLDWIQATSSWRDIYHSELIPVENGDAFLFEWDVSVSGIRYGVHVFDEDQKLLGATGGYIAGGSLTYDDAGWYRTISNLGSTDSSANGVYTASVIDDAVKYVTVHIFGGDVAMNIRHCSAYLYEKPSRQSRFVSSTVGKTKNITLPGVPTQGFAPHGTIVTKEDGTSFYTCIFHHDDDLNGAFAASATSITVTTISTVANGDVVGILLDNGLTHWSTVSGLSSSTFTIDALPSDAADGNRVVFNRWIQFDSA